MKIQIAPPSLGAKGEFGSDIGGGSRSRREMVRLHAQRWPKMNMLKESEVALSFLRIRYR